MAKTGFEHDKEGSETILDRLINPQFNLAPGVDLDRHDTWLTDSHFKAEDYEGNEGLPDWNRAQSNPGETQMIRSYLVKPTPKQVRSAADIEQMAKLIRDIAIESQQSPCIVSKADGDYVQVSSGHRRRVASINAGMKFIPCTLLNVAAGSLDHLLQQIRGNEHHERLSPLDKTKQYLSYLKALQDKHQVTLDSGTGAQILSSQFNLSLEEANDYLTLALADHTVFNAVHRGILTLKQGCDVVACARPGDKHHQASILRDYVKELPNATAIKRISGKTRRDGTGMSGRRGAEHRDKMAITLADGTVVNIQVSSRDELTPQQVREALDKCIRSLGIRV
jgi:ParB/RepB/Spo0J family partition protein